MTYEVSTHAKHIFKDDKIHKDFVTNLKSYEHIHKFNLETKRVERSTMAYFKVGVPQVDTSNIPT